MKAIGLKLMDAVGATYTRTGDTEGFTAPNGISSDLIQLGEELGDMSLKEAICYCQRMTNGICYEIIYDEKQTNRFDEIVDNKYIRIVLIAIAVLTVIAIMTQ